MTDHEKRIEAIAEKMADYFKQKEWLVIDAPRVREALESSGIAREAEKLRADVEKLQKCLDGHIEAYKGTEDDHTR